MFSAICEEIRCDRRRGFFGSCAWLSTLTYNVERLATIHRLKKMGVELIILYPVSTSSSHFGVP